LRQKIIRDDKGRITLTLTVVPRPVVDHTHQTTVPPESGATAEEGKERIRISNRSVMEKIKANTQGDVITTHSNHAGPSTEPKKIVDDEESDDLISSIKSLIIPFLGTLNAHLEARLGVQADGLKLAFEECLTLRREVQDRSEVQMKDEVEEKVVVNDVHTVFCDHCL
jgi:hypothetical protein